MYHPNIYKTSMCINFTNPQGNKCQWGFYCTHAHGQEDIRNPNKKSTSNDQSSQPQQQTVDKSSSNDKDKITDHTVTSLSTMINDKPKIDKRTRSISAQSSLASYQLNSDPNLYASTNGNHSRSPQFYNNSMSSHMQASNMQSYNSYNSPPNAPPTTNTSHNNANTNSHSSTPSRPHRADFSPLPYTQQQYRQQQFAPPQLNLHDPNTMYSSHHQSTQPNYHQDPSWTAHQQQKRGRSVSADTGLVPYLGNKASAQPSWGHRYPSHDAMNYNQAPSTIPTIPPTPTDELPHNAPSFGDGTRVSRTFNGPPVPSRTLSDPSSTSTKETTVPKITISSIEQPDNTGNKSPPPPTGDIVKNSPHNFLLNRDITFQDPSMLQPPRTIRSTSHGNLTYPSNSDANNPYLPNPNTLSTAKLQPLTASSSLPSSKYDNRVPPLPNQTLDKNYFMAKAPPTDC